MFCVVFADALEPPHPGVEHQMHFGQNHVTSEMANQVITLICILKNSFFHLILHIFKQANVTRTQVRRTWWMIKAYNVIARHFVNDCLSVVTVRVVHAHSQFD
jgi:hypothetical protein